MFGCIDENYHFWRILLNENKKFVWKVIALNSSDEAETVKSSDREFIEFTDCIEDAKINGGMACEPNLISDLVI